MSPPEIWGPALWIFFHTLTEKINENAYTRISPQLFAFFIRICKYLPCPECSIHASDFLAKVNFLDLKNKLALKNMFYLFHNKVNLRKKKKLFNYTYINIYQRYKIVNVVNNFIQKYQTKGNMKLLAESFQRQLIIKDFKKWFTQSILAFIPQLNIPPKLSLPNINKREEIKESIVDTTTTTDTTSDIIIDTSDIIIDTSDIIIDTSDIIIDTSDTSDTPLLPII